eukprot:gnl/MRDRNA2_/MRDRNA2_194727_c0_seq1.p1 gnl/MRDRNA2_/MRDRNA2_194727_c0~~gnl/MRDRNA2_/MRDRNA2_194727_c0_seq1.p1  ORF type:complete len:364 (+),score=74.33 gnl/MRDRNA2_/MRDRNA2_194727_c0_seq1:123-1094(+)
MDPMTKKPVPLTGTAEDPALFPMGSELMNELMVTVMEECSSSKVLKRKLFQVDFYTTLSGEALVVLLYHRKLRGDMEWHAAAAALKAKLGCELMARARKEKIRFGGEAVNETLQVDGAEVRIKQMEGAFSQPNAGVACQMLSWARAAAVEGEVGVAAPQARQDDLVEMYAGSGMFSIGLAPLFRNVLATEISKSMTKTAQENADANNATNVQFARLSAEELSEALTGTRTFERLKGMSPNLQELNISTVLVDPPRAGMGDQVSEIVSKFDRIIYISCNPTTCRRDYDVLRKSHQIERFAVFDQFPYTDHVEMGMLLKKRESIS